MFDRLLNPRRIRPVMEILDARRLLAADLELQEVGLPTTGNTILPNQAMQIDISLHNIGDAAVSTPFTVGAKLINYAIGASAEALILQFDDPNAITLGSTVHSQSVPTGGATQVVTLNVNVPGNVPAGTYALSIKIDSTNGLAEGDEGNNEGGYLDVQVLTAGGQMVLTGTTAGEAFHLRRHDESGPQVEVELPDRLANYDLADITGISIDMLQGDDLVTVTGLLPNMRIDGFDGNDKIVGGDGDDTLIGGANKDTLFGGLGADRLNGNGGNDRLFGEAGADRIYGYEGQDYLDGGSSGDRLEGGGGLDTMLGQSGNDKFFAKDSAIDQLFGASGSDTGLIDPSDVLSSVETTTT